MSKSKKKTSGNEIALNKKAFHEYFVEETYEAGIVLQGWEVKSLREGRVQLVDSYILLKDDEAWWLGGLITPLLSASTHIQTDAQRTRKLLLHEREIANLNACVDRQGYSVVPIKLYWSKGYAKLEIGLVKGKKQHDKRASDKDRDWKREKQRLVKGMR